ncbi:hypothetical protein AB0C70_18560 [Streptomyces sp. NPDC048564]|uniref:hypothetical protein n=1 Tax=unclassified Streptomyces TaxID=2593676 RepID=UPI00341BDC4A
MMNPTPDEAAARSLDLRSAASRLALLNDIAETAAPAEVLYNIAGVLDALRHPVTALGGTEATAKALTEAAAAVRDLMVSRP